MIKFKFATATAGLALILQNPRARSYLLTSDAALVLGVAILMLTLGWVAYDYSHSGK